MTSSRRTAPGDFAHETGAVDTRPALRASFELADNAMLLARLEHSVVRVVAANPAFRSACVAGHDPEPRGRTLEEVLTGVTIPVEHRQRLLALCTRTLTDGGAGEIEGAFAGSPPACFGTARCMPITDDRGDALVLLASRDAVERARGATRLTEHDATLSRAFQLSPAALAVSRLRDGRFLDVNEACCKLFEYSREEFIGRAAPELQLWDRPAAREQFLEQFDRASSVHDLEIVIRTRRGARLTVLFSAERVHVAGDECMVASIHDVTAERNAERLRRQVEARAREAQRLEALGILAGGIAHDFNNILTIFTALTDLAELDVEKPHLLRGHVTDLRKTTDRARALVRQVLTFSRRQRDDRSVLDLRGVVSDVVAMLRRTLPSSVELVERVTGEAVLVHASADQLHQVLINLGMNSAHAMRARAGALTVELDRTFMDGGDRLPELGSGWFARLAVRDEGEGMDEATIARIFEPFFTTKAPGEGTGLGLAVVHGIVHDHGGALEVASRPGEGATVVVYLPLHAGPVVDVAEQEPRAVPRGNGEHVLIVDDEPSVGQAYAGLLARIGYHATVFDDPRASLARFRETPREFEVVVADLTMPHLTGDLLAREIHTLRPELPVLLMSGYSAGFTRQTAQALGAFDLLPKPLDLATLATAVHRALAHAHDAER